MLDPRNTDILARHSFNICNPVFNVGGQEWNVILVICRPKKEGCTAVLQWEPGNTQTLQSDSESLKLRSDVWPETGRSCSYIVLLYYVMMMMMLVVVVPTWPDQPRPGHTPTETPRSQQPPRSGELSPLWALEQWRRDDPQSRPQSVSQSAWRRENARYDQLPVLALPILNTNKSCHR